MFTHQKPAWLHSSRLQETLLPLLFRHKSKMNGPSNMKGRREVTDVSGRNLEVKSYLGLISGRRFDWKMRTDGEMEMTHPRAGGWRGGAGGSVDSGGVTGWNQRRHTSSLCNWCWRLTITAPPDVIMNHMMASQLQPQNIFIFISFLLKYHKRMSIFMSIIGTSSI